MQRVIDALDNVANHVENNYNLIMSMQKEPAPESHSASSGIDGTFDDDDLHFEDPDPEPSPLNGMADEVMKDIFSKHVGPENMSEHLQAFKSAITWSEPFIIGLLCFHVMVIILAISLNRSSNYEARMVFSVFIFIIIRSAERLNEYGRNHWEDFATQDYFDKGGFFVTVMFSVPLLMTCFFLMQSYVREACRLMIEVKTLKLKADKQKQKQKKSGEKKKSEKSD